MIMTHVNASAVINQHAMLLTITTQIHVSAFVDHMTAMLVSILTQRAVAANAQSIRPVQTINTSIKPLANVSVVISRNVEMDNTMTTIRVNANAEIHQLASIHTITIPTLVNVIADLMTATLVNTLTQKAVVASALSTRPAQTINISMVQPVSVSAAM